MVQGSEPPTSRRGCPATSEDLNTVTNARAGARLLASSVRESGVWLNAQPISSLGLRMDDETIRIAVGLRLCIPLCRPHTCHHCNLEVDALATHGLSCRQSQRCHHQHTTLNDIIHRSLTSAKVPFRLEPSGLQHVDEKRPTALLSFHGSRGTFAPSYIRSASRAAGAVARLAEGRKMAKYSC